MGKISLSYIANTSRMHACMHAHAHTREHAHPHKRPSLFAVSVPDYCNNGLWLIGRGCPNICICSGWRTFQSFQLCLFYYIITKMISTFLNPPCKLPYTRLHPIQLQRMNLKNKSTTIVLWAREHNLPILLILILKCYVHKISWRSMWEECDKWEYTSTE